MSAMTFSDLANAVHAIECDERRMSVRFGCDCGCGGDGFSEEAWREMCQEADEAEARLRAFGVTFEKDDN